MRVFGDYKRVFGEYKRVFGEYKILLGYSYWLVFIFLSKFI